MALTVLSVAYPFAAVGPDAVGGAEQILSTLDRALTVAGHRSLVVACEGSRVAGTLLPAGTAGRHLIDGPIDDARRADAHGSVRRALRAALARIPVDLVHMHGIDFMDCLPPPGVPTLVTLHLPPGWYSPSAFASGRPDTHLVCVSESQARACPPGAGPLPVIANGVAVERFAARVGKRGFALVLGRVCPEKGVHLALDAAERAGMPLLIGGRVYPYAEHERYFRDAVVPRLGAAARFLGPVGGDRKRRLLAAARCLLVPSLAPETSSLVAMEAMAAGTPVVALRAGALPEIVEHGVTGFLVDDPAEMAGAMARAGTLDPAVCRAVARERFSARRMASAYLGLYARLAGRTVRAGAA